MSLPTNKSTGNYKSWLWEEKVNDFFQGQGDKTPLKGSRASDTGHCSCCFTLAAPCPQGRQGITVGYFHELDISQHQHFAALTHEINSLTSAPSHHLTPWRASERRGVGIASFHVVSMEGAPYPCWRSWKGYLREKKDDRTAGTVHWSICFSLTTSSLLTTDWTPSISCASIQEKTAKAEQAEFQQHDFSEHRLLERFPQATQSQEYNTQSPL